MNCVLNDCYKSTEHQNIHFLNFNPLLPNLGFGSNLTHWALGVTFKKITLTNSVNVNHFKCRKIISQPHSYISQYYLLYLLHARTGFRMYKHCGQWNQEHKSTVITEQKTLQTYF